MQATLVLRCRRLRNRTVLSTDYGCYIPASVDRHQGRLEEGAAAEPQACALLKGTFQDCSVLVQVLKSNNAMNCTLLHGEAIILRPLGRERSERRETNKSHTQATVARRLLHPGADRYPWS